MLVTKPLISVVIATRNRGGSVVDAVESVLENEKGSKEDVPAFEILVIDQSMQDDCQRLMQKYENEPRVIYQRSHTVGLARARNIAIHQAKGELIAITDDDCVVSKNWLTAIQQAFAQHPEAVIFFGNALPGAYDSSAGFIPSYCREKAKIISSVLDKNDVDGLGACMAMRKSVWQEFNGFDEMLGVGGVLKSSSEGDLVLKALKNDYRVGETPNISVVHNGFRTWEQGVSLIFRYWYGTGAMYGKHLKLYPLSTSWLLILLAWRWAFGHSRVADSIGPNTRKTFRLYAFISGLFKGLWLTVERETGHFKKAVLATEPTGDRHMAGYITCHAHKQADG